MNNLRNIVLLLIILAMITACNMFSETKTFEKQRGRLKFVETLCYGSVGSHGSQGWYSVNKEFYFNERKVSLPEEMDGCDASPNETVEAFNCYVFKELRVWRMS